MEYVVMICKITFQKWWKYYFFLSFLSWNRARRRKGLSFPLQKTAKAKREVLIMVSPYERMYEMTCLNNCAVLSAWVNKSTCWEGDPKCGGRNAATFCTRSSLHSPTRRWALKPVLVEKAAFFPCAWNFLCTRKYAKQMHFFHFFKY